MSMSPKININIKLSVSCALGLRRIILNGRACVMDESLFEKKFFVHFTVQSVAKHRSSLSSSSVASGRGIIAKFHELPAPFDVLSGQFFYVFFLYPAGEYTRNRASLRSPIHQDPSIAFSYRNDSGLRSSAI